MLVIRFCLFVCLFFFGVKPENHYRVSEAQSLKKDNSRRSKTAWSQAVPTLDEGREVQRRGLINLFLSGRGATSQRESGKLK